MPKSIKTIREIDLTTIDLNQLTAFFVGCVILTKNNRLCLQQRGKNWDRFPGYLSTFGGKIESGETPLQALIRELHEELGAKVNESEVIALGAIAEEMTDFSELVYLFFWHDLHGTIIDCYEGEIAYFNNAQAVMAHPKAMDDVRWALAACQKRGLF